MPSSNWRVVLTVKKYDQTLTRIENLQWEAAVSNPIIIMIVRMQGT